MSLQLVLQNYLASLKERDELDALLPELLIAMGHSVLSRPQVGVVQAGVDILSSYTDADGNEELYLFIIKFGDIGREDLFTGKQAILPSAREAYTDFARHRLTEAQKALPKRVVIVSSGVVKQEATSGFAGMADEVNAQPGFTFDFWGIDQLTPLIEKYVFDESLLLANGKSDLRAALAGLEDSQSSIHRFFRFIETSVATPESEANDSAPTRRRKFLRRCAAAAMGHGVLVVWGKSENNLKPAVVGGEYLALRLWAKAVDLGLTEDEEFQERLAATLGVHLQALFDYFEKVLAVLKNQRALVQHRPNPVFYAQLVFEELGRLATLLLLIQHDPASQEMRKVVLDELIEVINANSISLRPLLDGQGIDLSLVFSALMGEGAIDAARSLLRGVLIQLRNALVRNERLPVDTDLMEDAIAVHFTGDAEGRDFFQNSTLIPMLASVAAVLNDDEDLNFLRGLGPQLEGVTLERWYPTNEIERFTGANRSLNEISVSRVVDGFQQDAAAEVQASLRIPANAGEPAGLKWSGNPWEVLTALSARLHRHPLPTWYLASSLERVATSQEPESVPPAEGSSTAPQAGPGTG
ncbi:hypothetical protein [Pseudoxanthomonas sp. JBR18]|uniref:hypothetical protein n=1 Tax=Pseudoxanthomonas sp. JBR18 TaxID=2969308 RepID=UPI002306BA1C|nr:hypothetical protein [Pseudoxanthomonas sp. JBR18]WCE03852.1 hypothetical protein PJ250_17460 [Pseudoxanthomonas sp. JBR18]